MIKKYKNMLMVKSKNKYIISKTLLNLLLEFKLFNIERYTLENKDDMFISDFKSYWNYDESSKFIMKNIFPIDKYEFFYIFNKRYSNYIKDEIEIDSDNDYNSNNEKFIIFEFVELYFKKENDLIDFIKMIENKFNKLDSLLTNFEKEIKLYLHDKSNKFITHKDLSDDFILCFSKELKLITKSNDIVELNNALYQMLNITSDKKLKEINYGYLLFKQKHKYDLKNMKKYQNKLDIVCTKYLLLELLKDCINRLKIQENQKIFNDNFILDTYYNIAEQTTDLPF